MRFAACFPVLLGLSLAACAQGPAPFQWIPRMPRNENRV